MIPEYLYKRKLFGYTILIPENKQWTFSLIHSMKHYSSIYGENYLENYIKK